MRERSQLSDLPSGTLLLNISVLPPTSTVLNVALRLIILRLILIRLRLFIDSVMPDRSACCRSGNKQLFYINVTGSL